MYTRYIEEKLKKYLKIFPVVFLSGARQAGKTTFIKEFIKNNGYTFVTFDDDTSLYAAKNDPAGFIKMLKKPLVIDEVQRVPELFLSIKKMVDEENVLGQIILTGSSNPLVLPKISDSLAGRMGILQLYPFSQGEINNKKENFLSWIFSNDFKFFNFSAINWDQFAKIIYRGGFPRVQKFSEDEIDIWFSGYIKTLLERDIRDLSQIENIYIFPNLLKLLANRTGSLFNGSDLARTLNISVASVHRYIVLLEALYIISREQAWFSNHHKRIAKSPKIYISDSGLLSHLLNSKSNMYETDSLMFGFVLESFIVNEIKKQLSFFDLKIEQYHFRQESNEVDIVLEEKGGNIVGIEIKKSMTIKSSDFDGLKVLKLYAKKNFVRGIVLYSGNQMIPFGEDLWAVPITSLWEK